MGSLLVAYSLWLFGGVFGLQHLYLRRYFHAFAWLCTFGGFGIGWLWDLCQLPVYQEEDEERRKLYKANQNRILQPRCSTARFIGQLILGSWLGFLVACCLPLHWWTHDIGYPLAVSLTSLGVAWGVYVVGNIGLQQRTFWSALSGAWLGCIVPMYVFGSANSMSWGAVSSAVRCNKSVEWRTAPAKHGLRTYLASVALYSLLILVGISTNLRVTLEDGSSQSLGEICSELWKEWRKAHPAPVTSLFDSEFKFEYWVEEFFDCLHKFFSERTFMNPFESTEAYKVLGLELSSSRSEIKSHCRKLLSENHPDKTGKDGTDAFIRIQKACETLAPRASAHSHAKEEF